jgi:hypothetical protein
LWFGDEIGTGEIGGLEVVPIRWKGGIGYYVMRSGGSGDVLAGFEDMHNYVQG